MAYAVLQSFGYSAKRKKMDVRWFNVHNPIFSQLQTDRFKPEDIPLTVSVVEHSARPSGLSATTMYSPMSLGPTIRISIEHTPHTFVM